MQRRLLHQLKTDANEPFGYMFSKDAERAAYPIVRVPDIRALQRRTL
jgi:hypothetical protein